MAVLENIRKVSPLFKTYPFVRHLKALRNLNLSRSDADKHPKIFFIASLQKKKKSGAK